MVKKRLQIMETKENRELLGQFGSLGDDRSSFIYRNNQTLEVDLFAKQDLIKHVNMQSYPLPHARFVAEMWYLGLTNYIKKDGQKK